MNWLLLQGINLFSSSSCEGLLWIRKNSQYLEDSITNLITSILFYWASGFSPVRDHILRTDVLPQQWPEIKTKKLTLMVFLSHTVALKQVMGNTAGIFMKSKEISKLLYRKMDVFRRLGKVYNCPRKVLFADLSLINLFFYWACIEK